MRTDARIEINPIDTVPRGISISVMRRCARAADVHNMTHARCKRGATHRKAVCSVLRTRLKKHQMGSFWFATCRKAKLTAAWWRDRRDVYVMSTMHNLSTTTMLKQPKGEREKQPLHVLLLLLTTTNGWVVLI